MLVTCFPAPALGTNCYLLATGHGSDCVVVDPGIEVDDQLRAALAEHALTPVATLITHGHVDHVYCSATPQAPVYIHRADRYRLTDPLGDLPPAMVADLEQQLGAPARWHAPEDVVEVDDGQRLELAGLTITVRHAPGHTEGSSLFVLDDVPGDGRSGYWGGCRHTALTGDVLFAGTIGRTDLPGGDHAVMERSLRDVVLALPDDTVVLPGHGAASTMTCERTTNPFLQDL